MARQTRPGGLVALAGAKPPKPLGAAIGGLAHGGVYKIKSVVGSDRKVQLVDFRGNVIPIQPSASVALQSLRLATPRVGQDVVVRAHADGALVHAAGTKWLILPSTKGGKGVGKPKDAK